MISCEQNQDYNRQLNIALMTLNEIECDRFQRQRILLDLRNSMTIADAVKEHTENCDKHCLLSEAEAKKLLGNPEVDKALGAITDVLDDLGFDTYSRGNGRREAAD